MGGESDLEARGPMGRDRRGRVTWIPEHQWRRLEGVVSALDQRTSERRPEGRFSWRPVGGDG